MATALTEFYDEVRSRVPGCPSSILQRETLNVLRDICERTNIWKDDLDAIDVVADTAEYALTAPSGADFVKGNPVDTAYFNDVPIGATTKKLLDATGVEWQSRSSSTPSSFFIIYPSTVRLYPTPSEDTSEGLDIYAVLKPSLDATTVEDFFYDNHRDAVIAGVLARIFNQNGQPWYNDIAAKEENINYRKEVASILAEVQRGHVTTGLRAQPRDW